MKEVIQYMRSIHSKNILTIGLFMGLILAGCQSQELKSLPKKVELKSPDGSIINTRVAITEKEQAQGVSGIADSDFKENDGMLFFNMEESMKNFWMPDTYFNLAIIYLDKNLKVVDIEPDVQHHPGWGDTSKIPRAKPVYCRHVLELRADSSIAKKIKIGDKFTLQKYSLEQIEQGIRQGL